MPEYHIALCRKLLYRAVDAAQLDADAALKLVKESRIRYKKYSELHTSGIRQRRKVECVADLLKMLKINTESLRDQSLESLRELFFNHFTKPFIENFTDLSVLQTSEVPKNIIHAVQSFMIVLTIVTKLFGGNETAPLELLRKVNIAMYAIFGTLENEFQLDLDHTITVNDADLSLGHDEMPTTKYYVQAIQFIKRGEYVDAVKILLVAWINAAKLKTKLHTFITNYTMKILQAMRRFMWAD